MKKIIALLLCLIMVGTMTACGGKGTSTNGGTSSKENESVDQVKEPITIEYWHTLGDKGATALDEIVAEFNATNEYGITVNATYQGNYYDVLSKIIASRGTNTAPNVVVIGAGAIEQLASADALADMSGYMERDSYAVDNFMEQLRFYMQHYEGKIIAYPYLVSTPVIYYNKALLSKEPESLEEWVSMAKDLHTKNPDITGISMPLDIGFIQRPMLKSLGAPGLTSEDGMKPASLDDGSLEKYLTDWKSWIDEGICQGLKVSDSGGQEMNKFSQGKLASLMTSTASANYIKEACEKSGIELGVAKMVGYGGYHASIGGGGIAVLNDSTQQEKAASWEFLKFLFKDETQVKMHKASSYLPFTYSARESEELKAYWEERPEFKQAAEQLEYATYNDWSPYLSEWRQQLENAFTSVLIDGSMTPEETVDYLRTQSSVIFR